jgi:hypothetical protein
MSETVFVVCGTSGEYSDRYEWVARAFRTEDAARSFIEATTARMMDLQAAYKRRADHNKPYLSFADWLLKETDVPDPLCAEGWDEVSYYLSACELVT